MPRRKPIDRLREICLALPEATEKAAWSEPTFCVGGKMFVMFSNNHHNDGRVAAWCNATLLRRGAPPNSHGRLSYIAARPTAEGGCPTSAAAAASSDSPVAN